MIEPYSKSLKGTYKITKVNLTNWKSYLNQINVNKQLFLALDVSDILNKDTLSLLNEIKNILNNHYPILKISSKNLQW